MISVIVPTHNRIELLAQTLDALQAQTLSSSEFEIVVACDGCQDGTEQMLEKRKVQMPNLRYLSQPQSGPAAARNAAARLAVGEVLAFTDDDCVPAPDWLDQISLAMREFSLVGLQGRTTTDRKYVTPLTHQIENLYGHNAVPTCNAAFRRDFFLQEGGFDQQFPYAHNEDADLAWRLERYGRIAFSERMLVHHPPRPVYFDKHRDRMKILESEFLLYYKQPEQYKRYRSSSPWITIYYEVFLLHQLRSFRSRLRYMGRPRLMLQGMALNLVWWISLIGNLPRYMRAEKRYRKQFTSHKLQPAHAENLRHH